MFLSPKRFLIPVLSGAIKTPIYNSKVSSQRTTVCASCLELSAVKVQSLDMLSNLK